MRTDVTSEVRVAEAIALPRPRHLGIEADPVAPPAEVAANLQVVPRRDPRAALGRFLAMSLRPRMRSFHTSDVSAADSCGLESVSSTLSKKRTVMPFSSAAVIFLRHSSSVVGAVVRSVAEPKARIVTSAPPSRLNQYDTRSSNVAWDDVWRWWSRRRSGAS